MISTFSVGLSRPGLSSRELLRAGDNFSRKRWIFEATFAQPAFMSNNGGESVDDRGLGGRCRCSDLRGSCKRNWHNSPREIRYWAPWFRCVIDSKWEAVDSTLSVEFRNELIGEFGTSYQRVASAAHDWFARTRSQGGCAAVSASPWSWSHLTSNNRQRLCCCVHTVPSLVKRRSHKSTRDWNRNL